MSIFHRWGFPHLELLYTRSNWMCQQFCSLRDHSLGSMTDAFLKKWSHNQFYTFLPIQLIHKMLTKIKQDQAQFILIAPAWLRQHCYTLLVRLSCKASIKLPLCLDLISQDYGWLLHSNLSSLHLTAWNLRV